MQEKDVNMTPWPILLYYFIVVLVTRLYVKHAEFCLFGTPWWALLPLPSSSNPHSTCSRERCSVSPCGGILCSSSYSSKDTLSAPNPLLLSNANAFNSELYFPVILSQWFDMTFSFSLQMLRPHTLISANTLYYATIRQLLTSHHIHIAVAVGTCLLKNTFIGWNCLFPKKNLLLQYNLLCLLKFCLFNKIFATI